MFDRKNPSLSTGSTAVCFNSNSNGGGGGSAGDPEESSCLDSGCSDNNIANNHHNGNEEKWMVHAMLNGNGSLSDDDSVDDIDDDAGPTKTANSAENSLNHNCLQHHTHYNNQQNQLSVVEPSSIVVVNHHRHRRRHYLHSSQKHYQESNHLDEPQSDKWSCSTTTNTGSKKNLIIMNHNHFNHQINNHVLDGINGIDDHKDGDPHSEQCDSTTNTTNNIGTTLEQPKSNISGGNGTWYATISRPEPEDSLILFNGTSGHSELMLNDKDGRLMHHHHHHHRPKNHRHHHNHHRNHVQVHFHQNASAMASSGNKSSNNGGNGAGADHNKGAGKTSAKRKNGIIVHHVLHHHHHHHNNKNDNRQATSTPTITANHISSPTSLSFTEPVLSTKPPVTPPTTSTAAKVKAIFENNIDTVLDTEAGNLQDENKDNLNVDDDDDDDADDSGSMINENQNKQSEQLKTMAESIVLQQSVATTNVGGSTFNKFQSPTSSPIPPSMTSTIDSSSINDIDDDVLKSTQKSSPFHQRHRHLYFKSTKYSNSTAIKSTILDRKTLTTKSPSKSSPDNILLVNNIDNDSDDQDPDENLADDGDDLQTKEKIENRDNPKDDLDLDSIVEKDPKVISVQMEQKCNGDDVDDDGADADGADDDVDGKTSVNDNNNNNNGDDHRHTDMSKLKSSKVDDKLQLLDVEAEDVLMNNDAKDDDEDGGSSSSSSSTKHNNHQSQTTTRKLRLSSTSTAATNPVKRLRHNSEKIIMISPKVVEEQLNDSKTAKLSLFNHVVDGDPMDIIDPHPSVDARLVASKPLDLNPDEQDIPLLIIKNSLVHKNHEKIKDRHTSGPSQKRGMIFENNLHHRNSGNEFGEDTSSMSMNNVDVMDDDDDLMNNFDPTEVLKRMKIELKEEFDDCNSNGQMQLNHCLQSMIPGNNCGNSMEPRDSGIMMMDVANCDNTETTNTPTTKEQDTNKLIMTDRYNHPHQPNEPPHHINRSKTSAPFETFISNHQQQSQNKTICQQLLSYFNNENFRKMFSLFQQPSLANDLRSSTTSSPTPSLNTQSATPTPAMDQSLAALTVAAAAAAATAAKMFQNQTSSSSSLLSMDDDERKRLIQTLIFKQLQQSTPATTINGDLNGGGSVMDDETTIQSILESTFGANLELQTAVPTVSATDMMMMVGQDLGSKSRFDHPEHRFCTSCNIQFKSSKTYKVHKELYCSSRHCSSLQNTGSLSSSSSTSSCSSSSCSIITTTTTTTISSNSAATNISHSHLQNPDIDNNQNNTNNMAYGSNISSKSSSLANSQTSSGIGSSPPPSSFSSSPNSSSNSITARKQLSSSSSTSSMRDRSQHHHHPSDMHSQDDAAATIAANIGDPNDPNNNRHHHHHRSSNESNQDTLLYNDDPTMIKYTDFRSLFPGLISTAGSLDGGHKKQSIIQTDPINGMMTNSCSDTNTMNILYPHTRPSVPQYTRSSSPSASNELSPIYVVLSTNPLVLLPFIFNNASNSFEIIPSLANTMDPSMVSSFKSLAPACNSSLIFPTGQSSSSLQPFVTTLDNLRKLNPSNLNFSDMVPKSTLPIASDSGSKSESTAKTIPSPPHHHNSHTNMSIGTKRLHPDSSLQIDQPLDLSNGALFSPKTKRSNSESEHTQINLKDIKNELICTETETITTNTTTNSQEIEKRRSSTSTTTIQEHVNDLMQKFAMIQSMATNPTTTTNQATIVPSHVTSLPLSLPLPSSSLPPNDQTPTALLSGSSVSSVPPTPSSSTLTAANHLAAAAALANDNPAFAQYIAIAMAALTGNVQPNLKSISATVPVPPSISPGSGSPPHSQQQPHVDVVVKQGNSRCAECNIVFYKHENYLVHKKSYCASRRTPSSTSINNDSQPQPQQQSSLTSPDVNNTATGITSNSINQIPPNIRPTSASSTSSSLSYTTGNGQSTAKMVHNNGLSSKVVVVPEIVGGKSASIGMGPDEALSLCTSPSLLSSREATTSVSPSMAAMANLLSPTNSNHSANGKQSTVFQYFCAACGIKYTSYDNLYAHQTYYCLKRNQNNSNSSFANPPPPPPVAPGSNESGAVLPPPSPVLSPIPPPPPPTISPIPAGLITPQSLLAAAATLGSQVPGAAEQLLDFSSTTSLTQQWNALVQAAAVVGAKANAAAAAASMTNGGSSGQLSIGDYNCHKCKASYVSPETLAAHVCSADVRLMVDNHHHNQKTDAGLTMASTPAKPSNSAPSTSSLQTYKCTVCGYKGHTMRGMRTHVRVHAEELATTGAFEEDFIVQNTDLPEPSTGRRSSHGNSLTNPARQRRRSNNIDLQLFSGSHSNASMSSTDTFDSVIRSTVSNYLENAARRSKEQQQQILDSEKKINPIAINNNINTGNNNNNDNCSGQQQQQQPQQNHNCQFCTYTSNYKGNVIRHIKLVHKEINGVLANATLLHQQQQLIREAVEGLMNVDLAEDLTNNSNGGHDIGQDLTSSSPGPNKIMVNGIGGSDPSSPSPSSTKSDSIKANIVNNSSTEVATNKNSPGNISANCNDIENKYCSACNISFTFRNSYLAHKRYYCTSNTAIQDA